MDLLILIWYFKSPYFCIYTWSNLIRKHWHFESIYMPPFGDREYYYHPIFHNSVLCFVSNMPNEYCMTMHNTSYVNYLEESPFFIPELWGSSLLLIKLLFSLQTMPKLLENYMTHLIRENLTWRTCDTQKGYTKLNGGVI